MAVTFADLTVDPQTLVDADPTSPVRIIVRTNTGGAIIDSAANKIFLGTYSVDTETTATISLPVTNGATNPTNFQYAVDLEYVDAATRTRKTWSSGWFSFTAAANLASIAAEQYVPPTWMTTAVTTLQGYVTTAEAARDATVTISGLTGEDAAVGALIKGTAGAGPITRAALSASIEATAIVHLGAGTADDTTRINGLLSLGVMPKAKPGEVYAISAPLVGTKIDMTGATVQWKTGVSGSNLWRNPAATPQRSVTDAAATATSTTLTSATAAFTAADVGRTVTVFYGAGATTIAFTADITAVTNATTVELSKAAPTTATGLTANIHNRDTGVRVIGGTWDRGAAVGAVSMGLHSILVHFADDVTIEPENILSTALGAKYAVYLAAVTNFKVRIPAMDVISDGLHITGPASRGDVPILSGTTGDDMFALCGQDYPSYMASGGDITDIHLGTMLPDGSLAGYKILAGNGGRIDRIKADYAAGTTSSYAAWVGGDENYDATKGGTYGDIDLGTIAVTAGGELLKLVDANADLVTIHPSGAPTSGTKVKVMSNVSAVGGTVKRLRLKDPSVQAGQALLVVEGANNVVNHVDMDGPTIDNAAAALLSISAGRIKKMVVDRGRIVYTGNSAPIFAIGGQVDELVLVDTLADVSAASASGALVQRTGGLGFQAVHFIRGLFTSRGNAGISLVYQPTTGAFETFVDNAKFVNVKRIIEAAAALTVRLTNPAIDSTQEPFYNAAGAAVVTGSIASLSTTTKIALTAGTLRVNGASLPVAISALTPTEGDQVRNVSAAAADGWYVGPVVWDSSAVTNKWVPLRGWASIVGGTLAAGSLTVADTKITASSLIEVEVYSPSNAGALYVDSKTAGTGYVVKSMNAADNSVVRCKVICY